jgi:hypothetical protein
MACLVHPNSRSGGEDLKPHNAGGVALMIGFLKRATLVLMALCGSLMCLPATANAQGFMGGGDGSFLSDPFNFYYAFYLPNQQLQSLRPKPIDTINQAQVARQYYAQTDRRALVNPLSPYGNDTYDPLHPYSAQGKERVARPFRFSPDPSNADGTGPSLYYGRATAYFPGLRAGRGRNANSYGRTSRALGPNRVIAGASGAGGGGGMGGMGGMGGGMGGMGGMM